jgi:two-component system, LytTR family, response regulator
MTIRVLIVDDEPLAREGVAISLAQHKDVEIVRECPDGLSAVRAIRELNPDLVFLDIRMPGLDGFGVIEEIGVERVPLVIFLTAYGEHALRAFRVDAIDYLLKPVDTAELDRSLDRARRQIEQRTHAAWHSDLRALVSTMVREQHVTETERILIRTGGRTRVIDPNEIDWIEASGDYVTVHVQRKPHLVRESLRNMEERLARYGFCRIHRSILVKLRCVRELIAKDSGDHQLVLHDGTELRVSRSYRDALYDALSERR